MQLGHYHGPGPASSLSARMILHSSSIHVKIVYVKASLLGVVYPIHPSPLSNPNANKFDRKSALNLDFFSPSNLKYFVK